MVLVFMSVWEFIFVSEGLVFLSKRGVIYLSFFYFRELGVCISNIFLNFLNFLNFFRVCFGLESDI